MEMLSTAADPAGTSFAANDASQRALVDGAAGPARHRGARRPAALAGTARGPRQAAPARADRRAPRRRQPVPGGRAAGRRRALRRRGARRRGDRGHRARARPARHGPVQRRDREGRHVLPAHGEEAPAGAGDRAGEPAALHLPRRLRRRVPAQAGRGVPRPRPLRPDLLQPGADVRRGHPAGRVRDGLVHRGRRLRPGDERRDRDRARAGHDLPGRAAAGEGGDR